MNQELTKSGTERFRYKFLGAHWSEAEAGSNDKKN